MNAFRWKIRKEPRWKNIARRRDAQPATLHIHNCHPPNVHSQRPFKKPDNSTNITTLLTHARSGGAACAALFKMRSWEVLGSVMVDPDVVLYGVRASPFFPDAPEAESEALFQFQLVRQHASSHPSAAEALGDRAGCWMANDIMPDYSAWHVKDPIHAGRAPDYFVMPKGFSAEEIAI